MARSTPRSRDRGFLVVVAVAVVARLCVFPFTENKHADAPMRVLLAEHQNLVPGAAADPRTFFQFGPLPIEVLRPFLLLGGDARWLSRLPSLLAGIALLFPFFALARRMTANPRAPVWAALALACSPLAIQLSTTAASESFYLWFWLASVERLHAGVSAWSDGAARPPGAGRRRHAFVWAGLYASLAAVSRYDAWLAIPALGGAAWLAAKRDRSAALDILSFLGCAALLPGAYLLWRLWAGADPWFFARTISREHAAAATALVARLGGLGARAHQLAIWCFALLAVMTPVGAFGLVLAARRWRRNTAATAVIVAGTLAPVLVYLVRGLLLNSFAPLARFALVPGVVVLPLAIDALPLRPRQVAATVVASAVVLSIATSLVAFAQAGRIRGEAEALSPLTRLEPEDRAVAEYLAWHRRPAEEVFIDTFEFTDILVAHAAGIPLIRVGGLFRARVLCDTLAEERDRTQSTLFAAHDSSWGRRPLPDWPEAGVRVGGWRVARLP